MLKLRYVTYNPMPDLELSWELWVYAVLYVGVLLTFYIFRSIAIYTMAKKREIKNAKLAFLPCFWVYLACKLIGKVRCLGATFEKLALVFCLIFAGCETVNFIYSFLTYFPVIGNILAGKEVVELIIVDSTANLNDFTSGLTHIVGNYYGHNVANPYVNMGISEQLIATIIDTLYYVSTYMIKLPCYIVLITIYINLFRTYNPKHYILFTMLSFFVGIFAPLIFALRNKEPIKYSDYLRERYSAWYANGNNYGGPVNNGAPKAPPTPFEEFADKDEVDPGDPFENFNRPASKKDDDNDDLFD